MQSPQCYSELTSKQCFDTKWIAIWHQRMYLVHCTRYMAGIVTESLGRRMGGVTGKRLGFGMPCRTECFFLFEFVGFLRKGAIAMHCIVWRDPRSTRVSVHSIHFLPVTTLAHVETTKTVCFGLKALCEESRGFSCRAYRTSPALAEFRCLSTILSFACNGKDC